MMMALLSFWMSSTLASLPSRRPWVFLVTVNSIICESLVVLTVKRLNFGAVKILATAYVSLF